MKDDIERFLNEAGVTIFAHCDATGLYSLREGDSSIGICLIPDMSAASRVLNMVESRRAEKRRLYGTPSVSSTSGPSDVGV